MRGHLRNSTAFLWLSNCTFMGATFYSSQFICVKMAPENCKFWLLSKNVLCIALPRLRPSWLLRVWWQKGRHNHIPFPSAPVYRCPNTFRDIFIQCIPSLTSSIQHRLGLSLQLMHMRPWQTALYRLSAVLWRCSQRIAVYAVIVVVWTLKRRVTVWPCSSSTGSLMCPADTACCHFKCL